MKKVKYKLPKTFEEAVKLAPSTCPRCGKLIKYDKYLTYYFCKGGGITIYPRNNGIHSIQTKAKCHFWVDNEYHYANFDEEGLKYFNCNASDNCW
jgi:hypothetical protein